MPTLNYRAFVVLFLVLVALSCKQEVVPPGPTISQYYLNATVDGSAYTSSHVVIASVNGTILSIRGSAGTGFPNLAISLDNAVLGVNDIGGNSANQIVWTSSDANDPLVTYRAALGSGRGTVVLSRFDDKVEGTFTALVYNAARDSVSIADGTFYVYLQP